MATLGPGESGPFTFTILAELEEARLAALRDRTTQHTQTITSARSTNATITIIPITQASTPLLDLPMHSVDILGVPMHTAFAPLEQHSVMQSELAEQELFRLRFIREE